MVSFVTICHPLGIMNVKAQNICIIPSNSHFLMLCVQHVSNWRTDVESIASIDAEAAISLVPLHKRTPSNDVIRSNSAASNGVPSVAGPLKPLHIETASAPL